MTFDFIMKFTIHLIPLLEKQILDFFDSARIKINKKQRWMISHEISVFCSYTCWLYYLSSMPQLTDDEQKENYYKIMAIAYGVAKDVKKPIFSSFPNSDAFVLSRFAEYNDAAFGDVFVSSLLCRIIDDNGLARLATHPICQCQGLLSDILARIVVLNPSSPLSMKKDILPLSLGSLTTTTHLCSLSLVLYKLLDDFSSLLIQNLKLRTAVADELFSPLSESGSSD